MNVKQCSLGLGHLLKVVSPLMVRRLTPTYERVVVAPPPGAGTATGAVGGAIIGSIIAGPRAAGLGLLLGGARGAIAGSAADANAQAQVQQAQSQISQNAVADQTRSQSYRQVIGACLTARGYTIS
jgi:outer membrane lipoprotein SlyB